MGKYLFIQSKNFNSYITITVTTRHHGDNKNSFLFDCFSSEDRLLTTDIILQSLNDPLIQLFYEFLEWVLPKFVHLNKLFQSEKGVIVTLYSKMTVTYTGNRLKTIVYKLK